MNTVSPNDPAFPCEDITDFPGLTKREYMATCILAGLLADPDILNAAEVSVSVADDLIKELNKEEPR